MRLIIPVLIIGARVCACHAGIPALPPEQRAVVCIERYFNASERKAFGITNPSVAATGWFYRSTRYLVTAGHVTEKMHLSALKWSNLVVRQCQADGSERHFAVDQARVAYRFQLIADGLSVIELKHPFEDATTLSIDRSRLSCDEKSRGRFVCVGYQNDRPSLATGRFVSYGLPFGEGFRFAGFEYFEMRGQKPIALDFGSSGSPVFAHDGKVVAIVSQVMVKVVYYDDGKHYQRFPMPEGSATNIAVPIAALYTFAP